MKLIIDIPDELFSIFKKHGIMAFDYVNEYDKEQIAIAITHGTPYNPSGDAISREALKETLRSYPQTDDMRTTELIGFFEKLIDNAQAVEQNWRFYYDHGYKQAEKDLERPNEQIAWEQGYEAGLAQGKQDNAPTVEPERPKGECCGACYLCDVGDCGADMKGGAE